ncbi:MAG: hypothetical protein JW918_19085 [Anaerolineae bacterium]|nr:hypothetical protein [Anaerolineae bacterium]
MRRSAIFWGVIIILLGIFLLINNFVEVDIGRFFWPLFLILLGVWVLLGVFAAPRGFETEEATIPLEGAGKARVHIGHGAGRLRVGGGAGAGELLSGSFGGGLEQRVKREGDALDVKLSVRVSGEHFIFPWTWWGPGRSLDWTVNLNEGIPLSLDLETGASDTRVDLTDLRVTDLRLQTGASSSEITLPARAGHTKAVIRSGAASVNVRVPEGAAARVKAGGIADIQVNKSRFPRVGGVYQSEDYATAENKVDIDIETGVGSISVR